MVVGSEPFKLDHVNFERSETVVSGRGRDPLSNAGERIRTGDRSATR